MSSTLTKATVVLIAIMAVMWCFAPPHSNNARPARALVVDPTDLSFGTVFADKHFKWSVALSNPCKEPIHIAATTASCGCTSITPNVFVVEPGASQEVTLTIDLQRNPLAPQSLTNESFSVNLSFFPTGGIHKATTCAIRGSVIHAIAAFPQQLNFGKVLHSTSNDSHSRLVKLTGAPAIRDVEINVKSDAVKLVNKETVQDGEHRTWYLDFELAENIEIGRLESDITVTPVGNDNVSLPSVTIPVFASIVGDIEAIPESAVFGQKPSQAIRLSSRSLRRISSVEVIEVPSGFGVSSSADSLGVSWEIVISRKDSSAASVPRGSGDLLLRATIDGVQHECVIALHW